MFINFPVNKSPHLHDVAITPERKAIKFSLAIFSNGTHIYLASIDELTTLSSTTATFDS